MHRFTLAAGGALLVASLMPNGAAAETGKPVSLPAATMIGKVNFAAAAASRANAEAYAASASAKKMPTRPRLLPDGRDARFVRPAAASLPHLAPNAAVSAASGIISVGGFTGLTAGQNAAATGSELEPPDQGLAVNGGVVGEVVNNVIAFYKSGQPLTAPLNNAVFFGSGTVANLSDPHITFDPSVQRWFVDELTYSGPLGYGFYLAVSATSDATGDYNVYFIPSSTSDLAGCGKSGCLPDFPQVGYDANGFYITADLFGPRRFVAAAIYALPKLELINGRGFTPVRFTVPEFVMQPVVPVPGEPFSLANGGTEYFLTARNIYNGSTAIRLYEIENTFNIVTAPSTLTATYQELHGEAYGPTVPSIQPDIIGPYGRSQKATSSPMLDGGYNSFTANVKLAHGRLYAALTTGSADSTGLPRDNIAYFVIDITGASPRIADQGYIVAPDGYSISYPGLALNEKGEGYVGVTITNPDARLPGGYPSTAIVPFSRQTGPGSITVTGQGGATDDGFTGYGAPHTPAGVGRWGDFASAVVDAATGVFYTANEFIPNPAVYPRGVFSNWGTFITSIKQ